MRSVESLSLSIILRLVEEQAMKDNTGQVLVQAPQQIANFLLNEKRRALARDRNRHEVPVIIVADEQLHTPHYNVHRLRENELDEETTKPSYRRTTPRKLEAHALTAGGDQRATRAARPGTRGKAGTGACAGCCGPCPVASGSCDGGAVRRLHRTPHEVLPRRPGTSARAAQGRKARRIATAS
jgi:hypothetical protein